MIGGTLVPLLSKLFWIMPKTNTTRRALSGNGRAREREGLTLIWQMIEDWFRGILTDGILSNLSGLFDSVNTEVGEIATQVGTTPPGGTRAYST